MYPGSVGCQHALAEACAVLVHVWYAAEIAGGKYTGLLGTLIPNLTPLLYLVNSVLLILSLQSLENGYNTRNCRYSTTRLPQQA